MEYLFYAIVAAAGLVVLYKVFFVRMVVREYETGLLYLNGRFRRRMKPGAHRVLRHWHDWRLVDTRRTTVTVPGQEVLSSDNVGLKVSVAVSFEIEDPEKAVHGVQDFQTELYVAVQLALRSAIGDSTIDEVLGQRLQIGEKLLDQVRPEAERMGLAVHAVEVKDVMFSADLRNAFAQVLKARKEGQAALEKARGETAALRNLANAAKLLENNRALMSLRLIQSMADGSGNTFVLGVPHTMAPFGEMQPGAGKSEAD